MRVSFSSIYLLRDFMEVEVVLNSRSELLDCMLNEGIIGIIGEMIVSETDPIILVCFLFIFPL